MNAAHVHLMLVHVPVIGFMLALPLAAMAVWRVKERGWFGAATLLCVVAMLGAVGAFLSGEAAEDIVEALPGVHESAIHEHEERAELALGFGISAGSLALILMVVGRGADEKRRRLFSAILTLELLMTAGLFAYTANAGGKIRHTEIVSLQAAQTPQPGSPGERERDHDHDHDEDD
jgi:uncharacterized membrane protein